MEKVKDETSVAYSVDYLGGMPFWNEIVCGDSSELLRLIPSDTVDLVITSPPYFQQREYENGGIGNEKVKYQLSLWERN